MVAVRAPTQQNLRNLNACKFCGNSSPLITPEVFEQKQGLVYRKEALTLKDT
jgi:hypothetical protein